MPIEQLISPGDIQKKIPIPLQVSGEIQYHRRTIKNIIERSDKRLLMIIDLSSIQERDVLLRYAKHIADLAESVKEGMLLAVQVCGKKTLAQNQELENDELTVEQWIARTRGLMLEVASLGLPIASPIADMLEPQYLQDLMSWFEIGSSVIESPVHREIASSLSVSVGLKSGSNKSSESALNALNSIVRPHTFIGFGADGIAAIIESPGNKHAHIVFCEMDGTALCLSAIDKLQASLIEQGFVPNVMVDCTCDNSINALDEQLMILEQAAEGIAAGNLDVLGFMLDCSDSSGDTVPAWNKVGDRLRSLSTLLNKGS